MAIITISRQIGSLGSYIANALAEELTLNLLNKESLEVMLCEHGMVEKQVNHYDEKKPKFWETLSPDKDRYLHCLKTAIYEFARKGNCIIIGRGGQVLLGDLPGVLHVRIIAPTEVRIDRIKERFSCDARHAEKLIRQSDHDRSGFYKSFFHVDWDSPSLYDLVINTHFLSLEAAAELIKDGLRFTETPERQQETLSKLADLCLGQEIITTILYKEEIPVQFLEATVEDGVVTLKGSAVGVEDIRRCEIVARQVPGVQQVLNEIGFLPNIC
jgi:cytidylate kinase